LSCTGTNFTTGGLTSGSVSLRPLSTITYTVNCGGQTKQIKVTVQHRPGFIEN
jgi:hypothetical protein